MVDNCQTSPVEYQRIRVFAIILLYKFTIDIGIDNDMLMLQLVGAIVLQVESISLSLSMLMRLVFGPSLLKCFLYIPTSKHLYLTFSE